MTSESTMIPQKSAKRLNRTAACCLFLGAVILSLAILLGYYVIPYKIWEGVMKESKLIQSDNPRYNGWAKVPIPLYQNIYLFNVTNPDKVVGGEKPIMQQLGPYVYQLKLEKFDIQFNEENGTFFYRERIDFFFRGDLSNGSLEDPITFVNIPYVGAVQEASKSTISRYVVQETMKEDPQAQLFLKTRVGKLFFGGIPLQFIKDLSEMQGEGALLPNHTFGLMYGQNGSNLGQFEIYSGQKNPDRFGDIVSWNGAKTWKWWEGDKYCSMINGSDGIFQPYATKNRLYYMFMPSLCRSIPFQFESEGSPVYGVPVFKYAVPRSFLENPSDNPDNSCYFIQLAKPYPESGVFPMRGCGKGPMFLSQPHFYQGSTVWLNQSVGLSPDKEKHEMSLFLEPYTGTPMKVNVRFQLNVDLYPNKYFKSMKKIPKVMYPLFWVEQSSGCPEKDAETIRSSLIRALEIISIVTQLTVFIGACLILLSISLYIFQGLVQPEGCCRSVDCTCEKTGKRKGPLCISLPRLFRNPAKNRKTPQSSSVIPSPLAEALLLPSQNSNLASTPESA